MRKNSKLGTIRVIWVTNNEILNGHVTEFWARGTNEGVKKKDLNRGSVQRSGERPASSTGESVLSLKSQEDGGVIQEVWNTGEC